MAIGDRIKKKKEGEELARVKAENERLAAENARLRLAQDEDPEKEEPAVEDPEKEEPAVEDPEKEEPAVEDPEKEEDDPAMHDEKPASYAQLTAEFGDEPAFIASMMEQGATLARARQVKLAQVKARARGKAAAAGEGDGGAPVGGGRRGALDFDGAVAARVAGGMKRHEAIRAVAIEQPKLHQAYIKSASEKYRAAGVKYNPVARSVI